MKTLVYLVLSISALVLSCCQLTRADISASASASASSGYGESALRPNVEQIHHSPPNAGQPGLVGSGNPEEVDDQDAMNLMLQTVRDAVNAQPQLYDPNDVDKLLNDPTGWTSIRYLNQRGYSWRRAAQLALKNLRWRAQTGLSQLNAAMFPCDLFKLGLILEHGVSNQITDEFGANVGGSPVIWIRLGAFGNVVKHMEKFSAKRLVSSAYNSVRGVELKASNFLRKHLLGVREPAHVDTPIIENMSVSHDKTIQYILSAITWWLNDWEQRHAPGTKATLVLDFENTDFAFSSWSMGEFFVGLDDHFPDLFDQILGFRYKAKLWSLHSPISMFNRIFKSRVSSSPETDAKLKFINKETQLSEYITRVDVEGYSMLPPYIYGDCYGAIAQPPAGCQAAAPQNFDQSNPLFDPLLLQAVENEFYQICKPRVRT